MKYLFIISLILLILVPIAFMNFITQSNNELDEKLKEQYKRKANYVLEESEWETPEPMISRVDEIVDKHEDLLNKKIVFDITNSFIVDKETADEEYFQKNKEEKIMNDFKKYLNENY